MTDNEIIKALERCSINDCKNCPILERCNYAPSGLLPTSALGLINHLKTDNEILKKQLDVAKLFYKEAVAERNKYSHRISTLEKENAEQKAILEAIDNEMLPLPFETDFDSAIKTAKHEAIKEFAEKLKEKKHWDVDTDNYVFVNEIDKLVKQLIGGDGMTDSELIEALRCCHGTRVPNCDNCPNEKTCEEIDVVNSVIDLINRQKAELEKLKDELHSAKIEISKHFDYMNEAKSEAIEEFATRLKEKFGIADCIVTVDNNDVDSIVKEMTEEMK